jgi:hypothetical protein|eukprot:7387499-Prymnesium_polylepis.2
MRYLEDHEEANGENEGKQQPQSAESLRYQQKESREQQLTQRLSHVPQLAAAPIVSMEESCRASQ